MASSNRVGSGQCSMMGHCGSKSFGGKPLPCPYDGPAAEPADDQREMLVSVCGPAYASGPVCCSSEQVETLRDNFATPDNILYSCPACRNNFREFFCAFTCSPDQSTFVNVTSTQTSTSDQTAVKSVDFYTGEQLGKGFYDSCKNVQMGATNGFVMDLIGGGAKNYTSFFKFLGQETPSLGSPFQINFPLSPPPEMTPLNPVARNCADDDAGSRCTCIDCPDLCPILPDIPIPGSEPLCQIGTISCLSFVLVIAYSLAVLSFIVGYIVQATLRRRRETQHYERMLLSTDTASLMSPRAQARGLVGAASLSHVEDSEPPSRQSEIRELGRGASILNPIDTAQPRQYRLNSILRRAFYRIGMTAASYPWLTFALVFTVVGLLNIGWKRFEIETDPVRLWVSPTSESKLQKEFFDEHFGPFYRPQQIFVTAAENRQDLMEIKSTDVASSTTAGNAVLSWERLKYWLAIEKDIRELKSEPNGYTLSDVCFKPAGPDGACVVQSVGAWFGNDLSDYDEDTWEDRFSYCAGEPVSCLPDFQQPLAPHYVLGGVPETSDGTLHYVHAEALVVTYVVSDSLDPAVQERAMEWERSLRQYLVTLSEFAPEEGGLRIAFSTGVSLEEEINKSTNTDVKIVILSYLAMFFYISLTLGSRLPGSEDDGVIKSIRRWARNFPGLFKRSAPSSLSVDSRNTPRILPRLPQSLFVGSKFTLGLFGITLVILSVSSSVGLFSAVGVKVTLIIAEVIPFLVLAVGVDNVFILVHELDRQNTLHGPNASASLNGYNYPQQQTSPIESHRSPFGSSHDDSIDQASVPVFLSPEERVARTLAERGPSILLSSITETVAFALGATVPMPAVRNFALYAAGSVLLNAILQITVFVSAMVLDLRRVESNRVDCFPCVRLPTRITLMDAPPSGTGLGRIGKFIRRYYAPFLLKPVVKSIVILAFGGLFVLSVISMQHIELGLDQRLALPSDSYLVPYFNDMDTYLNVGPPVYFVSHDVDPTTRAGQQDLCGRFTTCADFSMANLLEAERKRPAASSISEPSASWIDDFLGWLNPLQESCCRVKKRAPNEFCGPRDSSRACQPCYAGHEPPWNVTMQGLPEGDEFMRYLKQWLISPTNEECALAGKASFGAALSIDEQENTVVASHFRTFHAPLKTQADFINSFASAHRVADEISEKTGTKVFPYSLHYVFFDQYAHIIAITQELLGVGLGAVLLVTALLLGSWRTGSIVTGVVALTVVSVMGVMPLWGVSLNAISLVNLVISLGISVEFCAHIARAFMGASGGLPPEHPSDQKERDERMWIALVEVGPSVLEGITFTKLIGMCVMAFTRSKLLQIYYFRMWLTLIIFGALHGLVLLPVILSLAGGKGFPTQEADEEWMSNAIRNEYEYGTGYAPFATGDDDDSFISD